MMENLSSAVQSVVVIISGYVPMLIAGFLVLFIGVVIASLLKDLALVVFRYFRLEKWLQAAGIAKSKEVGVWPIILSELIRWIVIFIFLMSAVEVWGIPKVADVLNQLISFLPNVVLAVVIAWIGLVASQLTYKIIHHSLRSVGTTEARILAVLAKYAIIFFTAVIILTQLGIAADIIKILFTGIVAMLALAGGLAFGLGGREEAQNLLRMLRERIQKEDISLPKK